MIKLLILTPNLSLPGGVNNFIKLLGEELKKEKFEIHYFPVGKTGLLFKDIFYPVLMFIKVIQLKKILISFKPDIVHINPSLASTAIFRDFLFLKIVKKEGLDKLIKGEHYDFWVENGEIFYDFRKDRYRISFFTYQKEKTLLLMTVFIKKQQKEKKAYRYATKLKKDFDKKPIWIKQGVEENG